MGILIKDMKMPSDCWECPLMTGGLQCGYSLKQACYYDRRDDCPLTEIEPHGKLIDADNFDHFLSVLTESGAEYEDVIKLLREQDVIIEAEE